MPTNLFNSLHSKARRPWNLSVFSDHNATQEYDLREAAKNGELNNVKDLLGLTYVDGKDEDGCTALSWAGKYFKLNDRKIVYFANSLYFPFFCLFQQGEGIQMWSKFWSQTMLMLTARITWDRHH